MTAQMVLATALAALTLASLPEPATAAGRLGTLARYWEFSDGNDLRDLIGYWAPGPFHVQLEYWDFVDEDTDDQFRPEVGIHLRDRRRSAYNFQYRNEGGRQDRIWVGTDQVLTRHFVGRIQGSPIFSSENKTLWVVDVGLDYYWGSWNFASVTVVRDPRSGGLWVVPMRVRVANERNDWIQATLAPASERSLGWALDAKWGWAIVGVERNSRYDFTDVDNLVFTAGVEFVVGP
jgi:hypothetical protein